MKGSSKVLLIFHPLKEARLVSTYRAKNHNYINNMIRIALSRVIATVSQGFQGKIPGEKTQRDRRKDSFRGPFKKNQKNY